MGRILTVEQAAEKLQVRPNTVRAWLRQGKIPGRKIGRVYRVPEDELDASLSGQQTAEVRERPSIDLSKLVVPPFDERKSAFGAARHMPGSVEDFLREKRREVELEEHRWEARQKR